MQTVSVFDEITIERNECDQIRIFCDNVNIPSDSRNLAYKAAISFFDQLEIEPVGIDIRNNFV